MTERIEHVEHPNCRCKNCRLVRFAQAVIQLLRDGVPKVIIDKATKVPNAGDGTLTTEEYALLFESSVHELHEELVLR
ncbi:MAG: hypothetical protein EPN91_08230 [Salinibacterium sp.]|nr:MAG: hypothetical protein EPN91_08230 [Salinibacterium sp.]